MRQWHLIYTKARSEVLVQEQLENRDVENYLPLLALDRGYRRGVRYEPFFPHYIFVCVDLQSNEANGLPWLPGVRCIVHFDERPAVVPDEMIAMLRAKLDPMTDKVLRKSEWIFQPGQPVKIKRGAFEGLDAIFQKQLNGKDRVLILLDMLGKWVRTKISVDDLKAA